MKNLDALFNNKGELKNIPITNLQRSEFNDFEIGDIEDLKSSILSMGLLTPLSVIGPNENGIYSILSGERRFTAIKAIHEENEELYTEIPCLILDGSDLPTTLQKLVIEVSNVETRDFNKNMHYFKIVQLLREIHAAEEVGNPISRLGLAKQMAERLKMSPRYCSLIIQVFDEGSPNLVQAVQKDEISMAEANDFRRMVSLENKRRSDNGEDKILDEDIDKAVDEMRAGKKAKEAVKDIIAPAKEKKSYTLEDLENVDIDDFEFPDPDENLGQVSSTSFTGFNPNTPTETKPKRTVAAPETRTYNVYEWCNNLLSKDSLSDSEQDIVYLMSKIVDKFL